MGKKVLLQMLDEMPKLPSHYCRRSTKKVYVEPVFGTNSMSGIYREYCRRCSEAVLPRIDAVPIKPLSRFTFDQVIKEKNISFQPPVSLAACMQQKTLTKNISNSRIELEMRKIMIKY